MGINKINRVVLHEDLKTELDDKATRQELQSAKEELENALNETYQGISWKPVVSTFDDLRVAYPNAKDGWKATVGDTNTTYQYDLETDTWFPTSINALPLVTSNVDGIMSKEDKEKLDTVEKNAQKNLNASQMLEQIKTIDGEGSGLDSDLFQGKDPDYFAKEEHNHDGLYHRKSEINALLNDKAPKNHFHSKEQISDFEHDHIADEIIESATKRFVSDEEKSSWNDADNKKHIHENKTTLDKITQVMLDAWNNAVEHISDTIKHITSDERARWNTVGNKVDKVEGKELSDENYTIIEKNKLVGIEAGANKYIHPTEHPALMIAESENRRFVSDAEKSTWNHKETPDGSQEKADLAELNAKSHTDSHIEDSVKHIISTERDNWNNKANLSDIPTKVSELENDKSYVTSSQLGNAGYGDMVKSEWDKNNDGIIDLSEDTQKFGGHLPSHYATQADVQAANAYSDNLIGNKIIDNRSVAPLPSDYPSNRTQNEFKYSTSVGLDGVAGTYVHVFTERAWSDPSGGYVRQLAYDGSTVRIWTRFGNQSTNVWGQWVELSNTGMLEGKVDKLEGKQLSTEDYTTTEKNKLRDIENGANKYIHPATHPVSMIIGLHSVATSGNYSELNGKLTKLSQFENDIYYKGSAPPTNTNLFWFDTNI